MVVPYKKNHSRNAHLYRHNAERFSCRFDHQNTHDISHRSYRSSGIPAHIDIFLYASSKPDHLCILYTFYHQSEDLLDRNIFYHPILVHRSIQHLDTSFHSSMYLVGIRIDTFRWGFYRCSSFLSPRRRFRSIGHPMDIHMSMYIRSIIVR